MINLNTLAMVYYGQISHKELLFSLIKRDFLGRYRGSFFGIAWSLFNPLLMLAIYTIVFSVVFKAQWRVAEGDKVEFAIVLFCGLIVFNFFAECLNRAPHLIVGSPNFVKKVVFPLEVLPTVVICSALLHFLISLAVLIVFCMLDGVRIHVGSLLFPVVLLPLVLLTQGLTWLVSSLGVYLRDLAQGMGIITTIFLYLSPIFYQIESLPEPYRHVVDWNPLTYPVVQLRDLILWGNPFQWDAWAANLVIGLTVNLTCFWWFEKTRHGFADVL